MLQFKNILNFPSFFKERQVLVKQVTINIKNVTNNEDGSKLIQGTTGKFQPEILIIDGNLNLGTNVKINCDCPSFKFDFSKAVNKIGSLSHPEEFQKSIALRPKERNLFSIASGCKHIIALANLIYKHPKLVSK